MSWLVQLVSVPALVYATLRLNDSNSLPQMAWCALAVFLLAGIWIAALASCWECHRLDRQEIAAKANLIERQAETLRRIARRRRVARPAPPRPLAPEPSRLVRPDDRTQPIARIHVFPGQKPFEDPPINYGETQLIKLDEISEEVADEEPGTAPPVPVGPEDGAS